MRDILTMSTVNIEGWTVKESYYATNHGYYHRRHESLEDAKSHASIIDGSTIELRVIFVNLDRIEVDRPIMRFEYRAGEEMRK